MSTATRTSLRRDPKRAPSSDPPPRNDPNPKSDPIPIAKPSKPSSFPSRILSKSLDSSQTHKLRTTQKPASRKGGGGEFVPEKGFEGLEIEAKKETRLVCSVPGPGFNGGGGGGRRRSFGGSRGELADVLASNGVKVVSADMPPLMQIHAVELARKVHDSLEKFTSKTLASTLKKEFDGIYGPAWHCIVGKSFGSFVTHSVGGFLYFSMDQKMYILLFKTTVQRAD